MTASNEQQGMKHASRHQFVAEAGRAGDARRSKDNRRIYRPLLGSLLIVLCIGPLGFDSRSYLTDPADLSSSERSLYRQTKELLDDWTGDYDNLVAAKGLLDRLIKNNDRFLPAYIELARYKIMFGATFNTYYEKFNRKALAILEDVQRRDPDYVKSYVLAGRIYINLQEYSHARASLEKAEALGTNDPWLYLNWAALLRAEGNYQEALIRTQQALLTGTDNLKAIAVAISDLVRFDDFSGSRISDADVATILFELSPDPDAQLNIAEKLIVGSNGRSEQLGYARTILERFMQRHENSARARMLLAKCHLKNGYLGVTDIGKKYDEASLVAAEKLLSPIQDDPEVIEDVFVMSVEILLNRGNFGEVRSLLEKMSGKGLERTTIASVEARLAYLKQDYRKVLSLYRKFSEIDPAFLNGSKMLRDSYIGTGQLDIVEGMYRNSIRNARRSAWLRSEYARFLLNDKRDIDTAIKQANAAVSLGGGAPARTILATAYYAKGGERLQAGEETAAKSYYEKGERLEVPKSRIMSTCSVHCEGIRELFSFMEAVRA